ncbi:MAG: tol-pal system protein YbgF [Roseiarcus sp.]
MTPLFRLRRASAVVVCLGLFGAPSARAFDLNPFHSGAPQQTAQSTLPPAAIPGAPGDAADANDAGALDVRIDRLEDELRQANGRIEELENQQHRLEDQLKRFQQDVEFRLGSAGAGANPVAATPPAAAAAVPPAAPLEPSPAVKTARRSDAFNPTADPNAIGAPRPLGTTPPSAPLANSPLPTGAPLNLSDRPNPPPAPPSGPLVADTGPTVIPGVGVGFTDGPRDQYNAAIEAYRNGQYAQAEEQLKAFLTANGSNRLAPDAIFYLGETYFQRSRPREAAEQYLKLSTDYSKSARAPEGMLRLGQALAALGSNDQACATFAEVGKRYPTAAPAVKKSAEREMQKAHC